MLSLTLETSAIALRRLETGLLRLELLHPRMLLLLISRQLRLQRNGSE